MTEIWNLMIDQEKRRQCLVTIPGYSPAVFTVDSKNGTLRITLSDGATVSATRPELEGLHSLLTSRGFITEADVDRSVEQTQWIFAVIASTGPHEFCARPVLFILKRDAAISGRQINQLFKVAPLGGIRWRGSVTAPDMVVAITNLDHGDNPYHDRLKGTTLIYTGQGLTGDQALRRGNAALARSRELGAPVFVLGHTGNKYVFLGKATVENYHLATAVGRDNVPRFVYEFELRLQPSTSPVGYVADSDQIPRPVSLRSGREHFRPKARLVQTLLGRELVSNELVAILELVKNAYDADSESVTIRIAPNDDLIEIRDDGHGMTLERVTTAWLEPATPSKAKSPRSMTKRRRVLGNKGIGRFAASRLGNSLELVTLADQAVFHDVPAEEIHVYVSWAAFDDPEAYLDQINFSWEAVAPTELIQKGTIVRIRHLASDTLWDSDRIYQLRSMLSRMVSPFDEVKDFSIILETPYPDYNGRVDPFPMLKHPHYSITGSVQDNGHCDVHFKSATLETTIPVAIDKTHLTCGPFSFEFRVWNRDDDDVDKVKRELDNAAGVSIYRDGFRVLPYGERKNDWLRLDIRRVNNPTMAVSNNQVVGAVFISGDLNPLLRDQSNREGLIDNKAVADLRDAIILLLAQLEQKRYQLRPRQAPESHRSANVIDLEDVKRTFSQKYPSDGEFLSVIEAKSIELSKQANMVTQTLVRYRRLATLGRLVDMILHDGRHPLGMIKSQADVARFRLAKAKPECFDEKVATSVEIIRENGKWLSQLFKRLEPLGGREVLKARNCFVEDVIANTIMIFSRSIKAAKVKVKIPETHTTVFIHPSELQQVIVNLLDNSLYWLSGASAREIDFSVWPSDSEVTVLVADSGPGVDPDNRDFIFDPYFTTKPEGGKGLGLFIAAEILRENDGTIKLVTHPKQPGACFEITLKAGSTE